MEGHRQGLWLRWWGGGAEIAVAGSWPGSYPNLLHQFYFCAGDDSDASIEIERMPCPFNVVGLTMDTTGGLARSGLLFMVADPGEALSWPARGHVLIRWDLLPCERGDLQIGF